ncbi:hypothetical protein SCE1572_50900 [Sorangium cellulosum So0157-2]|uniref:Uncharacterized protein n=1 Tax=Sorangium cellulosum So0157-2 TaxID=1254432 RepID=S4YCH2_SORCE|nr:hypothetical protein SCE1572_50900 [Sorangium cellulosum So0157-2]
MIKASIRSSGVIASGSTIFGSTFSGSYRKSHTYLHSMSVYAGSNFSISFFASGTTHDANSSAQNRYVELAFLTRQLTTSSTLKNLFGRSYQPLHSPPSLSRHCTLPTSSLGSLPANHLCALHFMYHLLYSFASEDGIDAI